MCNTKVNFDKMWRYLTYSCPVRLNKSALLLQPEIEDGLCSGYTDNSGELLEDCKECRFNAYYENQHS